MDLRNDESGIRAGDKLNDYGLFRAGKFIFPLYGNVVDLRFFDRIYKINRIKNTQQILLIL